jgi:hypothetical protein
MTLYGEKKILSRGEKIIMCPSYTFERNGEQFDMTLTYDDMIKFLEENPDVSQVFKMNLVDPVGIGVSKPPADFQKYVIGRIKDSVPGAEKEKLEKRWTVNKEV